MYIVKPTVKIKGYRYKAYFDGMVGVVYTNSRNSKKLLEMYGGQWCKVYDKHDRLISKAVRDENDKIRNAE